MADETIVLELLNLAKSKRHGEVKAKLSKVDKPTQRAFKEVLLLKLFNLSLLIITNYYFLNYVFFS